MFKKTRRPVQLKDMHLRSIGALDKCPQPPNGVGDIYLDLRTSEYKVFDGWDWVVANKAEPRPYIWGKDGKEIGV